MCTLQASPLSCCLDPLLQLAYCAERDLPSPSGYMSAFRRVEKRAAPAPAPVPAAVLVCAPSAPRPTLASYASAFAPPRELAAAKLSRSVVCSSSSVAGPVLGAQSAAEAAPPAAEPARLFEGMLFCVSGAFSVPQAQLRALLQRHGGQVESGLTKRVTHLLTSDDHVHAPSYRVRMALKYGTALVGESWLHACVRENALLDTDSPMSE